MFYRFLLKFALFLQLTCCINRQFGADATQYYFQTLSHNLKENKANRENVGQTLKALKLWDIMLLKN